MMEIKALTAPSIPGLSKLNPLQMIPFQDHSKKRPKNPVIVLLRM